jgi:chemotaxis protein methyltransferase CheR
VEALREKTLSHWGSEEEFEELRHFISQQVGFNCNYYKIKCFKRRVFTRLRSRKVKSYKEYYFLLKDNPKERYYLEEALTINVSKFFRNYETFKIIKDKILPALVEQAQKRNPPYISILSAGAATGEEPYSIAILLDLLLENDKPIESRIVAIDVSEESLRKAREGIYSEDSLSETPAYIKEKYFSLNPPYHLSEKIKNMVVFKKTNFFKDRLNRLQDLILCRNVIIYFTKEFQDELFEKFYKSLAPGGYLVLGKVETILGKARYLFKSIDLKERIYQKI